MTTFAIDVSFNGACDPYNVDLPVALAYGWAVEQDGGAWQGNGQRPNNRAEQIKVDDTLIFTFNDSSGTVTQITDVEVLFAPGETANPTQPATPFGTQNPLQLGSMTLGANGASAGCNVRGNEVSSSGYEIANAGDFEMTISFVANGTSFQVDPEMEVIRR